MRCRVALVAAIIGIAGYLAFLTTIDVPMYLTRWRAEVANGSRPLSFLEGLRDASFRWVVTHDITEWKDEIAWMSLYLRKPALDLSDIVRRTCTVIAGES